MKQITIIALSIFILNNEIQAQQASTDTSLLKQSEKFLNNIREGIPTADIELELAKLDKKKLLSGLNNEKAKNTFWLNMYNGWFQILAAAKQNDSIDVFSQKKIKIAGILFTLNEIEHGILRRDFKDIKGSSNYLFVKQLAVSKVDYRMHFALNCGAKSCPPIATYNYKELTKQLDRVTFSFLSSNTQVNDHAREVYVTELMNWYNADFGGNAGIHRIIKKVLKKNTAGYTIKYSAYNWEASLRNFIKE